MFKILATLIQPPRLSATENLDSDVVSITYNGQDPFFSLLFIGRVVIDKQCLGGFKGCSDYSTDQLLTVLDAKAVELRLAGVRNLLQSFNKNEAYVKQQIYLVLKNEFDIGVEHHSLIDEFFSEHCTGDADTDYEQFKRVYSSVFEFKETELDYPFITASA